VTALEKEAFGSGTVAMRFGPAFLPWLMVAVMRVVDFLRKTLWVAAALSKQ